MTLEPGKNLGHYRLVEKIGEGGMGVVWKAVDTSLDRDVAIKILPDALAGDPTRLARFEREAKLLASLNHPGIAVIHGLHAGEGLHFLAMELIPGEDLAQRLARGPVPLNEALAMALQIAEAMEAAHDRGVIHRDLKPANILVTPEGTVKILDFGLAKALSADGANDTDMSMSPTMTSAGTIAGMILGTAAYMSPEQAHGRPVDRRADIWAFGVVLFELISGKGTFRGESVSDTLASVLKLEPDWSILSAAPASLTSLLRRCLTKDPHHRLQAIGEARIALEKIGDGSLEPAGNDESGSGAPSGTRLMALVPWSLAGIMAVVAAVMLWSGRVSAPPATPAGPTTRLHISLGSDDPDQGGLPLVNQGPAFALSPEGQRVAYILNGAAGETLWVRELNSLKVHLLPETTGATAPFFSADGESIGFFAGGQLKRTPVAGGPVTVVAEARTGRGGTWCADGSIVFAPDVRSGLVRVSAAGGTPEPLTTLDPDTEERSHRWPSCLADGSAVLFMTQYDGKDYDDGALEAVNLDSLERTTLHLGGAFPRALNDRHLLFARRGQMFHAPLDAAALTLTDRATPVLDDLMSSTGNQAAGDGSAQFAVNDDGLLIYRMGWSATNSFPMIWVDREGKAGAAFSQPGTYTGPRVSPDGRKVAYGTISGTSNHIVVLDLEDGKVTRLTFGDGSHYFPVWTWDSQHVIYSKDTDYSGNAGMGGTGIFITRADGSEAPRMIFQGEVRDSRDLTGQRIAMINPSSPSPDMRTLVMQGSTTGGGWDLSLLHLDANGKMESQESFAATQFTELYGEFSPDGSLIAYQSNESGITQIYVRPYPDTGGRWQISSGGGAFPRWSGDGTELFFRAGQAMMAVSVARRGDTGRPRFGRPTELFQGTFLDLNPFSAYDPAPDGQRFVMFPGPSTDASAGSKAVAVFNWLGELEK